MLIADEGAFRKRTAQMFRNHQRRAAKDYLTLRYTLEELRGRARSAVSCAYCGCVLTLESFTLDHRMPVGRRADAHTWTLGNLANCCRRCNECKSMLTHEEFSQLMAVVLRLPPQAQQSVLSRLRAGGRIYRKQTW